LWLLLALLLSACQPIQRLPETKTAAAASAETPLEQANQAVVQRFYDEVVKILGIATLYDGDAPAAHQLLDESLRFCMELNNQFFLARVCTYLAELALWTEELGQAGHWLTQSLTYRADPHSITIFQVTRLFIAARLATAQQQYPRAATLFGLADQMHSQIHHVIGGPMRALADAALATVRAVLEPVAFAEAFAAGQQMSLEQAFASILVPSLIPGNLTDGAQVSAVINQPPRSSRLDGKAG